MTISEPYAQEIIRQIEELEIENERLRTHLRTLLQASLLPDGSEGPLSYVIRRILNEPHTPDK